MPVGGANACEGGPGDAKEMLKFESGHLPKVWATGPCQIAMVDSGGPDPVGFPPDKATSPRRS